MELDRQWNWQKKKLACRIRPENGNPAGDNLREMFAELAGVDLNELLNEMKQAKKKREATDKVTTDFEAEKKFKEVLSRSRILGASSQALGRMEEYDKIKATTVTQKNVKKVYTVLPKSPPKRVMVEIQRERSKPLRLPDQDEHKIATNKLEKKLAKQRAARMAAIEQSAKNEEAMKKAANSAEFFVNTLNDSNVFSNYGGDLFSTGGHYLEGMLYLSRMADSSLRTKRLDSASTDLDKKKLDESQSSQDNEKKTDKSITGADSEEGSTGDHGTNPDANAKLQCAASLCNWSRNPANAQRLATEGAVRAIMQLSLEPIHRVVEYCAAAFRFMSEFPPLAVAMIEDGAITTISELISSHTDDFVTYNLAIALVNLTRINGKEGQVVEAAIVLALMNLIMIKPDLGSTCVRGLYNLTCVDVSYPSIERVIRALVSLSLSGSANVKHLCAAALCNLSDLKSVRARMVEEGAINVLTTLSRGAETRTRRICAVILQNLSAAKSVRVEMASRNSVAAAYGLSSDQDPIILRCIGLTLSRLSMESTNCQRIIHEGGIAALCNIAVKYPTIPGITQPVASAFQLLSSNQPYRVNMVNEGSVTAIASLLRSSVDMFTLQHSLLGLCNLLCEGENHLPIIQQGLILTLIAMCNNENDLLKDFCSLAFLNLSCTEDSRKHLVNAGAVAAIISIAKQNSAVTKKRCAATLCNLSYYSAGMGRMVSDGIIPLIVDLVLAKDIVTVHYSCAALCRLCSTMENAKLILDSGAVPNLVQGAIEGDDTTKQFCGSVLSSLSFYEYCRIPLVELGAIKALKGLAQLNDDVTKQRCLVAFANLSCEVSVQLKMIEEGVVSIIAELANSYQEINYICCAKAICNLACCETTKPQVAKEGGVLALMMISMVQSVDRLTKLLCVLGLNNLLDDTTIDFMVGEGLVGSIGNLSKIGDAHISNLCSKIFNSLSKYDVARAKMVERNATMHALFKLCESTAAETRSTATRTCCNLVFDLSVRQAVVKAGVLGPLEKGIDSEDEETSFQCLAALFCLCSESIFMEQMAKTTIPVTLLKLTLKHDTPENRYELSLKVLSSLAYERRSRFFMQTHQIISMLSALVKDNFVQSSSVWIASTFSFLIHNYGKLDELVEMGVISTLTLFHSTFNGDRNEEESAVVYKALAECFRILSELKSGLNELANNAILQLFKKALQYIVPIAEGEKPSSLISKNDSLAALCHIAVVLYRFANNETGLRIATGTFETSALLEKLLGFQKTIDVACVALGMYLMDTKSRVPFIKPAIALAMKNVLSFKISENTLSNLVIAMYAISKVATAREFLTGPSVQLDRVLIQLSGSESAKIKANVNRAYKNLNADLNEAIEEGAVANLIAMSLEGKLKNQSSDEFAHPILEDEDTLLDPLKDFDSSSLMDRWYAKVSVTKGGAAGKGPEPPEPPAMSTDGSAQYPNMMEELDGGEADGKTKMSFAKMQIPTSLKEQYLMTDSDFLFNVDKEEVPLVEESNGNDSINSQTLEDQDQEMESKSPDQRDGNKEIHHRAASFRSSRASSMRNISRSSLVGVIEENAESKGNETPEADRNKRILKKNVNSPTPGSPSPDAIRKARKTKIIKDPNGPSISEQAQKLGLYS